MKRSLTFMLAALFMLMTNLVWGQARTEVTDQLTRELTGVTVSTYTAWEGVTINSEAVYAGQSAGGNNSIQLRSNNNNSGIITTSSGGTATSISVTWNSNTAAGRTLNVYGKNTAYTSPTELYNEETQGTLIGTIVKGTSTEIDIPDQYTYIGLRSANGAMYLEEIDFTWLTSGGTPIVSTPTFSPAAGTYSEAQTVTISCSTDGATIYYTTDGNTPTPSSSVYSTPIVISETTTLKAMAAKAGMNNSNVATAVYIISDPTQIYTVSVASGIVHGTVVANPTSAAAGSTVTVTATPDAGYELETLTYSYTGTQPISIMGTMQFVMPAADVTVNATFNETSQGIITIAEARALNINEYALVQGIVTFMDGRNIYIQDATAGIDLYLNTNTVPEALAIGDMVKAYGKISNYKGLVELSGINGGNADQFSIISSGNELPLAVQTIAEILADFSGANMLQSTRVKIVDATVGNINTANNTPITQDDNTLNIYKMPVVEGLVEGDIVTVVGIIGCFNNPQLRVNSAADIIFTHSDTPTLTATPTALSGFHYVEGEGPSDIQSFVLGAINLTSAVHVYPSENFEISSVNGDNFVPESNLTISGASTFNNIHIYVRLKAGLEIGTYSESITMTSEDAETISVAVSGSVTTPAPPVPSSGYTRVSDISQLTAGSKVIFAARFDGNAHDYYAMTAQASGKPEGVLFTSGTSETGAETLPAAIADAEETYYWNVSIEGNNYTFTNANGDVLGYTSSTNFSNGGDNTAWGITYQTSEATAMVPNYSGFVVGNVNNAVRAIALNSNHNFGPYHTQNMVADNYNFFLDMFATVGGGTLTCATPTFTPEGGTYYEAQEVTIACATADATIYYTLDGSDPTENSSVYESPIIVPYSSSMTIKAIAMKEGYENSNIATAEYTIISGAATIFEQDWEGEMNGWTFVTVEGSKPWTIGQYQGNHYANANGYNGGVNEQWCISPAFNLNVYSNASLSFRNAKNYNGPDMQLYFSNNYDGVSPASATWVELEFNKSTGSYAWTESGTIDLAGFAGEECYIGFKYISTETAAAAWEVDDITLMGSTTDPYLTVTPNSLSGFTYIVGNGPSAAQTFTVSGGNLPPAPGGTSGGVGITCSNSHYEFSLDGEEYWSSLTIQVVGTLEPTTVYVRLEDGLPVGQWDGVVTLEDGGISATVNVIGSVTEEPIPGDDWNRIQALGDLHDGDQVIIAARYDATVGNGYYAMTAGVSGKPDGVLFTSVNAGGVEKLPAEIADDAETYLWNVTLNGDVITLTNAAGDMLGYSSSTNFTGNENTEWNIVLETSSESALIPNYTGFVITNGTTTNRGIAKNASNKFGAYATSNMGNTDYNFYLDLFVSGGSATPTVATPVFSVASGTYYETIEVEITCATQGATIHYTTDGSAPTAASTVYTTPITVSETMTIKAIAMKDGLDNSNIATAEYTIILGAATIFEQDWEGDMNGWTFVTVEGSKPWIIAQYQGNHYANANGYNGGVNEQWCISPAFNLDIYTDASLTFRNAKNYTGPDMQVYFSNNYDGENPASATWVELEYIKSTGSYAWVESGTIDLANFTGEECYIGFKYTSTEDAAAAWEVDDIALMGSTTMPYLTVTPNSLSGFTYIVGNGPSAVQTFTVAGGNLPPAPGGSSGGVGITCSNSHYEFSLDGEEYWSNLTIQVVGTLEPTTVYVRLEEGLPVGQWDGVVTLEDGGTTATVTVTGSVTEEPIPGGDWNRIQALNGLHDGDQVIIAARYDATIGNGYYAMTAGVSGKPEGVLFTSVNAGGTEKLPSEIADEADTYMWNVTVDDNVITLTNAAGDMLGYSSSTNFAGNENTEWNIALETSSENALIPNYTGFVITNGTTTNRGIAKNASNKFGAYATSNMSNPDYNFYLDLFVYGGSVTPTVATPVFSVASGTYYETFNVEITCATEGATIYYTTDGSNPTAASTVYDAPITISETITVKAIAMMEGYDNSAIATANYVIMGGVEILVSQDWEGEMDGWTFVTIEGNKPWFIGQYNGNHYANANGYNDDVDNEQWCISPAFNLNARTTQNVTLTFMNATKFNGPALELYFSNDYDGSNPLNAEWTELSYTMSEGNYTWTESGEISLNSFSGENCYIAFKYISTIAEGAAAWEIDDIMIVAEQGAGVITAEAELNVDVWNNHNELMIVNGSDNELQVMVYNLVGQPVLNANVATGSNVIRHDLAEGVYIVRIANGKEMKGVKVVVRR